MRKIHVNEFFISTPYQPLGKKTSVSKKKNKNAKSCSNASGQKIKKSMKKTHF
jgi:hypothetical protein